MTKKNSRSVGSSAASVFFSLLLVITVIAGGAGTARAQTIEECSELDEFLYTISYGIISEVTGFVGHCDPSTITQEANEILESENNQTALDIYLAGTSQVSQMEVTKTVGNNYLNDSHTTAWSKAEVAIAEAWANGSTKTETRADARQAIDDYYSRMQVNRIKAWNVTVSTHANLADRARNESGVSPPYSARQDGSWIENSDGLEIYAGGSTEYTLANGTTVGVARLLVESSGSSYQAWFHPKSGPQDLTTTSNTIEAIALYPPSDETDRTIVLDFAQAKTRYEGLNESAVSLKSEVVAFNDAVYSGLENGTVDSRDIISRNTLLFEYGTKAIDGNDFYDSVGAIAALGLDTPGLSGSGLMEIEHNNSTFTGMVFARNAPNGTWEKGVTYNASNITGPVFIASTTGDYEAVSDEFTITSLTNKNGETVNSVETTEYNYQTANVTDLIEKMERTLALSMEIQDRQNDGGTGGTGGDSGFNFNFGAGGIGVLVVAGAAVYLLASSRD